MLPCRRVLLPFLPRLQRLIIRPHPLSSASHLRHLHIALPRSHTGPPAYSCRYPARCVFRQLPLARLLPFQSTRTDGHRLSSPTLLLSHLRSTESCLVLVLAYGLRKSRPFGSKRRAEGRKGEDGRAAKGRRGLGVDLRLAFNPEATRWSNSGGSRWRWGPERRERETSNGCQLYLAGQLTRFRSFLLRRTRPTTSSPLPLKATSA